MRIGELTGDSGVTGMILPIFMGIVSDAQKPERESSEAINQILTLSITQIEEAFARGYIECMIEGETRRVNARDPFSAYALTIILNLHRKVSTSISSPNSELPEIFFLDKLG